MGFLTEEERRQLRIESMILHVVGEEEFDPQPTRLVEHSGFFIGRILDTDVAAVYQFKEASGSRDQIQNMAIGITPLRLVLKPCLENSLASMVQQLAMVLSLSLICESMIPMFESSASSNTIIAKQLNNRMVKTDNRGCVELSMPSLTIRKPSKNLH